MLIFSASAAAGTFICGVREVGELLHLVGGDIGEFAAAIADIDAPQPGHGVEVGGAVGVVDRRAVRAGDHHLLGLQQLVLDDGVQDVLEVLPHHGGADFGIGGVGERHGDLVLAVGTHPTAFSHGVTRGPGLGPPVPPRLCLPVARGFQAPGPGNAPDTGPG